VFYVAAVELLDAGACTGYLPREHDLGAECAGLHYPVDGGVTGLSEVPATLQRVRQPVGHDAGVQVRFVDLLNVYLWVLQIELALECARYLPDVLSALPDDHPGLLGLEHDLCPHRGLRDLHAAVAGAAEFVLEELVYLCPLEPVLDELLFVSHLSPP
jgi:hypothetical protein